MAAEAPKRSVMVVDDSGVFGFTLSLEFRKHGWDVFCCGNADEALKKVKDVRFDLVLSDLHMPGMTGDLLAAAILKDHPETRIIVMSSAPRDSIPPLPKGVAFLPKPLNVTMILAAFEKTQQRVTGVFTVPPPPPPSHK